MASTDPIRRAPLLVRVPPPAPRPPLRIRFGPLGGRAVVTIIALLAAAPVVTALALVPWQVGQRILFVFLLIVALAAAIVVAVVAALRKQRRTVEEFRTRFAQEKREPEPLAEALEQLFTNAAAPPGPDVVLKAIHDAPLPDPPRARVVVLGPVDVPQVGELRFEPEVIPPTRLVWKFLLRVPIAVAFVAAWLLGQLHVYPFTLVSRHLGGFTYFLVVGAVGAAVWVWRAAIRPSYIRLAPGIVQCLVFTPAGGKPTIRTYPMTPGTVAVITRQATGATALWLFRGTQRDMIDLSGMRNWKEVMPRFWDALLSTAPTPPLSDEELVG